MFKGKSRSLLKKKQSNHFRCKEKSTSSNRCMFLNVVTTRGRSLNVRIYTDTTITSEHNTLNYDN